MSISDDLRELRAKVGSQLLQVPSVSAIIYDDQNRMLLVKHCKGKVCNRSFKSVNRASGCSS